MKVLPINPAVNHLKDQLLRYTPGVLAVITAAVLLLHVPDNAALARYSSPLLIYALLIALAEVFSTFLTEGELSVAHVVGIVAFLSMEQDAVSVILWTVFLGGITGSGLASVLNRIQLPGRQHKRNNFRSMIFVVARLTLSFFVASQLYIALQGALPLPTLATGSETLWHDAMVLVVFSLFYVLFYFALFLLELYNAGHAVLLIISENLAQILTMLFLPVPFAILGVNTVKTGASASYVLFVIGIVLVIFGLHAYSRSEYQLRRQVVEWRSLSVVTQAMRAHLNLETLLKTIYLQVAHLLDTNNFIVALYEPQSSELKFPLIIRDGNQEQHFEKRKNSLDGVLLQRVLDTHHPLLLRDNVYEQAQRMGLTVPRELVYSWLGVPLLAGSKILGAIISTSSDPHRHFDPDDLRLLNIIAASASIAIENAQLYHEQIERVDQLSNLNTVSTLLSTTLSPDSVLDTIISSVSTMSNTTAVAVYLYWEEDESRLALMRSAGFSDAFIKSPANPLVADNQSPKDLYKQPPFIVHKNDTRQQTGYLRQVMAREGHATWVELPLAVGETGLGVLVLGFDEMQSLAGEGLELLRTFALQASQAINNARLYATADQALDRRVEQLFALAAMGRLLTATMNTQQVCDLILSYATDATKANLGMIVLRDEHNDNIEIISQRGYPLHATKDPEILLQSSAGQVLESGKVILSGDIRKEPGYLPLVQTTHSQLAVPILRGKIARGVIQLESKEINAFTEEDSYFVGQIANQAVIAVDNVRLFQRITEARDRLQVLLDTMEEAIIMIDDTGRVVLANPRVNMISLQPSQMVDKRVSDLLEQDDCHFAERTGFHTNERLRQFLRDLPTLKAWDKNEPMTYEVRSEHGQFHIQRQIIPVRDDSGNVVGAVLTFYNRTEEEELARARDDLSRMIVHDLRSPLTAVTTSLRLLQELVPVDSDFRPVVESTTSASQRAIRKLLARVDSLLDISKMESGQLSIEQEPAELANLVDSVCVELSPLAHELDVKLASQLPEKMPLLDIDADKVERLLLNLVDNALKYSPENSTVTIRAVPDAVNSSDFLRVEVVDQGPGIPDEYKKNLFDRFVQIEGRRKVRRGVGLGLTFCRLVAEGHGGRIWIEDNPGKGSIFAFTLPIVQVNKLLLDDDNPDTP